MKEKEDKLPIIGIIGTGWVGSSYYRLFKSKGYEIVCYSLDDEFIHNKKMIKNCDIVFISVPTPTTQNGFDDSILLETLQLVDAGKIAVIKSTVIPGTTNLLQEQNPSIVVIHSPEFLSVLTADSDASNPKRNIIGLPMVNNAHKTAAALLLKILPEAPYTKICSAIEAEIIKYAHNCGGYLQVIFHNILYDVCRKMGGNWEMIRDSMMADPDNINSYLDPIHKNGRGAGGPCFIKDFHAFSKFYERFDDKTGSDFLNSTEKKNISLLTNSGKDIDILNTIFSNNSTV